MLLLYDKELTELEMAEAMRNRAKNEITELRINNLYLESIRLRQVNVKDAHDLQQMLKQNKRGIAENEEHIAFLESAIETLKKPKPETEAAK